MGGLTSVARLPWPARRLAIEALSLLPRAALSIKRRPFLATVGFGAVPIGAAREVDVALLGRIVAAVARRLPFRAMCFEQGLTVQRMLRRRGLPAVLHYGIDPADGMRAHVWVSLDGRIVHGGETAEEFTEVGCWG
ncbi:lasso peptide biosynthesis B2 protein [Sphingomonas sp. LHG3406-1]|uniref:lasso peptide biosynthesis B2 protein n=1 Tax=Sphingomonas sp. LHG3406-1 TaxID=2804617 RepID=UPI0026364628|nr:lasso peptide biosynthesis B2 protein [Sphingomonas sp. LHG3406-1]